MSNLLLPILAAIATAPAAGSVPTEAVGDWRWGTINPGWFENKYTGAYEGHAGGTSAYFTFTKDGHFRRLVYIETNSYGWRTQVMTTTEGTVEFDKDTFRIKTEKGKYKSVSNRVERHNYERPMTDDERAKDSKTVYHWRADKDDKGRPILRIGFDEKTLSIFQKEK